MSSHAAAGAGAPPATSAPATSAPRPSPRSWPRDVSTRVIPRFDYPYSLGEDVFSLPLGALNGVLSCLTLPDASRLRLVCRDAEAHVTAYKWADATSQVRSLKRFRAAFPRAVAVRLHPSVVSPDWVLLTGITTLALGGCDLLALLRAGLDAALEAGDFPHVDLRGSPAAPLVNYLLDDAAPPQLASAAGAALGSLQDTDVTPGDDDALLWALAGPPLTAEQAVILCRALVRPNGTSPFEVGTLRDGRATGALVSVLLRFPGEATVQQAALHALAVFTPDVIVVADEGNDGEEEEEAGGEDGGGGDGGDEDADAPATTDNNDAVPAEPDVLEFSVSVQNGTVQAAVAALATHGATAPAVAEAAVKVLAAAACTSEDEARALVAAGGLLPLLAALEMHGGAPATAAASFRALAAVLAASNPAAFLSAGGLRRVLAAMRAMLTAPSTHADTLVIALSLLQTLVATSAPCKAALVEAGGLSVLASALAASVEDRELCLPAADLARVLAQEPGGLRPQLLAAGIVPLLLDFTRLLPSCPAVAAACRALRALAASRAGAAAIDAAGGLHALVTIVTHQQLCWTTTEEVLAAVLAVTRASPSRLLAAAAAGAARSAVAVVQMSPDVDCCLQALKLLAALAGGPPAAREAVVAAAPLRAVVAALRKRDVGYSVWREHVGLRVEGLNLLATLAGSCFGQAPAVVAAGGAAAAVSVLKANQWDRGLAEAGCSLLTALLDSRALSLAPAAATGVLPTLVAALRSWAFVEALVERVSTSLRRLAERSPLDAALVTNAGGLRALLHAVKRCSGSAATVGAALQAVWAVVRSASGGAGVAALAGVEGGGGAIVDALAAHPGVANVVAPACALLAALARNGGGGGGGGGAMSADAMRALAAALHIFVRNDAMHPLAAALSAHLGVGAAAELAAQALLALCGVPADAAEAQRVAEAGVPGVVVGALRAGALSVRLRGAWTARLKLWVGAWPPLAAGVADAGGLEGLL